MAPDCPQPSDQAGVAASLAPGALDVKSREAGPNEKLKFPYKPEAQSWTQVQVQLRLAAKQGSQQRLPPPSCETHPTLQVAGPQEEGPLARTVGREPAVVSTITHQKLLPAGLMGGLHLLTPATPGTWPLAHLCVVRMSTGPSPTCPSPLPTAVASVPLSSPWAGPAPDSGVTRVSPSAFKSEANTPLSIFIFLLSTSSSTGSRSSARF